MKRIIKSISKKGFIPLCLLLFVVSFVSCDKEENWEYKVISISGTTSFYRDLDACTFIDPTGQLNALGKEGWELVTTYTEVETKHPNFGNKEYVTGLQPNTRTHKINFVLKRRFTNDKK